MVPRIKGYFEYYSPACYRIDLEIVFLTFDSLWILYRTFWVADSSLIINHTWYRRACIFRLNTSAYGLLDQEDLLPINSETDF
jgi:hypothetical protein